jgi:hypothetical protein
VHGLEFLLLWVQSLLADHCQMGLSRVEGAMCLGRFLAWLSVVELANSRVVIGIGLGYARSLTVYGHDTTTYTFNYVSYVTSILCVFAG